MLITTIPGSLDVLKVWIAANVNNIQPNKGSEKNGALLELTSGVQIHSANAACSYFFEDGSSENIDSWLEWENVVLRPICYHVYISSLNKSTIDTPLWEQFLKLLRHLDNALTGKQFLIGGSELSCADIVIWSTLYTAVTQVNLLKDCPAVTVWFESLAQTSAFANAVKDTDLNKNNIKKFLTSGVLPALPTNNATVDKGQKPAAPITNEVKETVAVTPEELKAAKSAWEQPKIRKIKEKESPILPMKGEENVMITSALPYVNNVPHLGNIIGCVLSADIYARYRRLCQDNVLYICGTDEYGTTTETKALEEGITPKEICDKYNALHTEVYDWFGISFDYFGRTSTPMQTEVAHDIFWKLEKNGYICKDTLDQLQCVACNRFLADRFVNGTCPFCAYDDARGDQCDACGKLINAVELKDPKCSTCKASPRIKTTKHLFIDLPKLEGKLETYLEKQFEEGLWTNNARVITKSWIRDGLKPRCITRDLKWGVPVPLEGYTDKVFYVWYDAPIGYISITANYTDQWKKWWKAPDQVDYYNFMAKDNIPFHSVIFPSCLLGADDDWTIVNHMSATEYLNYEDGKFSKSRGVGVFGNQVRDTGIPADIWRFYLLYVRPESQDSCFSWDDFVTKNNSELLNNLGNFINRGLMFTANFFKGVIPAMTLNDEDLELIAQINREISNYNENLQKIRLREGLRCVLMISKLGNQYIQANKPWVLVKGNETEKLRAGTVIGLADNVSCLLSVLLEPYMPETSSIIQAQLNTPKTVNVTTDTLVCWLKEGHQIGTPKPLFQKIEPSLAAELKKKYQGKQQPVTSKASGSKPATQLTAETLQKLNDDITAQGNKVRDLKAAKAEKSKITAEVKTLLALKAQLTAGSSESTGAPNAAGGSQSKDATTAPLSGGKCDQGEIDRLTEEVKVQGDKVREMKSSGAEKSEINSAVQKLLELKNSLAKAQGIDPAAAAAPNQKSKGKKKRGGKKK